MRFAASELEAGDLAAGEMDFAADQSMRPGGIEWEGVSEQTDRSLIVGAADEDHGAAQCSMSIEGPVVGEGTAGRSILDATGGTLMRGLHAAYRTDGSPRPRVLPDYSRNNSTSIPRVASVRREPDGGFIPQRSHWAYAQRSPWILLAMRLFSPSLDQQAVGEDAEDSFAGEESVEVEALELGGDFRGEAVQPVLTRVRRLDRPHAGGEMWSMDRARRAADDGSRLAR